MDDTIYLGENIPDFASDCFESDNFYDPVEQYRGHEDMAFILDHEEDY